MEALVDSMVAAGIGASSGGWGGVFHLPLQSLSYFFDAFVKVHSRHWLVRVKVHAVGQV